MAKHVSTDGRMGRAFWTHMLHLEAGYWFDAECRACQITCTHRVKTSIDVSAQKYTVAQKSGKRRIAL